MINFIVLCAKHIHFKIIPTLYIAELFNKTFFTPALKLCGRLFKDTQSRHFLLGKIKNQKIKLFFNFL